MGARGPKPWEPSPEEKAKIELYASLGATKEDIGLMLGKSADSIDRHARGALEKGMTEANLKVAGVLFRAAIKGNITAAIFWAKTQMGWRETERREHTGPNGGPIEYRNLEEDEIDARLRTLAEKNAGPDSNLAH